MFGSSCLSLRCSVAVLRASSASRFVLVGKLLVLAAADHAAVRRGAHIEIGIGRLPDHALARPEPARLRHGGDGPGRCDLCARAAARSLEIRSRWRTPDGLSGCACRWPPSPPRGISWHRCRRCRPGHRFSSRPGKPRAARRMSWRADRSRDRRAHDRGRASGCRNRFAIRAATSRRPAKPAARRASCSRVELVGVEQVAGEVERVAARSRRRQLVRAVPPAHRPRAASAARRGSRRACRSCGASFVSGVSIAYCTSAVLAVVEPLAGPRRSTTATLKPSAESASATIAPVMPAPITSTSVSMSRVSRRCGTGDARPACQTERPVRKSLDFVTTVLPVRPVSAGDTMPWA